MSFTRNIKRYSDPAQALYTEGEQLAEWLLTKYNAITVLENSNRYEKSIKYTETILLKSQSIRTKQIQQLSEDEIQGLRDAKNRLENHITENLQNNIKFLEDKIADLTEYNQNNQNGIKTKDDLIYQQGVQYLKVLNAENEKLKNYLIEKHDQCVKLNVNISVDNELIQKQDINFSGSEFDVKKMIEKLESDYENLKDVKKNLIINIREQLNNKITNFLNEDLESEKNKLKEFITNQCQNFDMSIRSEVFNAFNGLQLINDIQILREEKERLKNHLKEKFKEKIDRNQSIAEYDKFNEETKKIEDELTLTKDKNDEIIDRQQRLQNKIDELDKEGGEEDSSINNINGARHQLIQTLFDNINEINRTLENHLTEKYDLLIQFVNLNDENPDTKKYLDKFKSPISEKDINLRKNNNNEVIILYGEENIVNTCQFQILYEKLKTYSNVQLEKTINDFNYEKRKLEEKSAYINATKTYEIQQTNIRSLHKKLCELKSDLVNRYNLLIKLEKITKVDDSSIYSEKVKKLMDEIQPFSDVFENANQHNINNLIDDCEQTINKFNKEISNIQAERDYIVTTIDNVKVLIEGDLINKYTQLIQLEEFKKWTLISDEYHNNIKKIQDNSNLRDTNNIPNPSDTNDGQNNTDRIRELETNVSNLKGDINLKDEEIRELKGKLEARDIRISELFESNSSLRNEAIKYSSELGKATNFEFGDHDINNIGQLSSEIKKLRIDLEYFCKLRKSIASINEQSMKKLLKIYKCSAVFSGKNYNKNLLEGLLQRHIIQETISKAEKYLNDDEFHTKTCLEAKIQSVTNRLQEYTTALSMQCFGTDKVSSAIPTKLRQMVYTLLSNRGFSQNKDKREHPVIERLTKDILNIMSNCRTIIDPVKNKDIESMAIKIVQQIIVIFLFRFKVQEPIIEYLWFESGDNIELEFMEFSVDEELKNAEV
ncbi:2600_t:CDS:1, partial [Scutellospora calospora]